MLFRYRGQLRFRFCDHPEGVVVGFFAVASFVPHPLCANQLLLGAIDFDLFRLERVGGQDSDAVGKHLDESPTHVVAGNAVCGAPCNVCSAVDRNVAGAQLSYQRRGAVEHFHVARSGR